MDFQEIVNAIRLAEKIVVLAGAGMSTSCGIPDFRSKDGLYALARELGVCDGEFALPQPECIFDIAYFDADPRAFFAFAARLLPPAEGFTPSLTHLFLRELDRRAKLQTCFTQNVDGIEAACGVRADRVIQCHGTLATARCRECGVRCNTDAIRDDMEHGRIARCRAPSQRAPPPAEGSRRSSRKRKRPPSTGGVAPFRLAPFDPALCGGIMKPDVTFFGEPLNASVGRRLTLDRAKVDLLLVIGTSLSVAPISDALRFFPGTVKKILINRQRVVPRSGSFDAELLGDCDVVVAALAARLGWTLRRGEVAAAAAGGAGAGAEAAAVEEISSTDAGYEFAPGVHIFANGVEPTAAAAASSSSSSSGGGGGGTLYTCDACAETIASTVYTCNQCFAYDLCASCATRSDGALVAAHAVEMGSTHAFTEHPV